MNLDSFIEEKTCSWGSAVEIERRNRIKVAVAAYAYEFESDSIMSDADFDALCLKINPNMSTVDTYHSSVVKRYKILDKFFKKYFSSHTGQWIYKHPELHLVKATYEKYYKNR